MRDKTDSRSEDLYFVHRKLEIIEIGTFYDFVSKLICDFSSKENIDASIDYQNHILQKILDKLYPVTTIFCSGDTPKNHSWLTHVISSLLKEKIQIHI